MAEMHSAQSVEKKRVPGIWTMSVLNAEEAEKLGQHIRVKATEAYATGGGARESLQTFEDWLRFQFQDPLDQNAKAGPQYSKAFNLLSVFTIAAGLASSLVAGVGNGSKVAIGVLGVAVGVFTAVNRIWNPARRSIVRYQAAYALRREGWNLVNTMGRYAALSTKDQIGKFMYEVDRIHREVEAIDEMAGVADGGG